MRRHADAVAAAAGAGFEGVALPAGDGDAAGGLSSQPSAAAGSGSAAAAAAAAAAGVSGAAAAAAVVSKKQKQQQPASINHFHEKLLTLKGRMKTEAGRKLAEGRHAFMEKYLEQFAQELAGDA